MAIPMHEDPIMALSIRTREYFKAKTGVCKDSLRLPVRRCDRHLEHSPWCNTHGTLDFSPCLYFPSQDESAFIHPWIATEYAPEACIQG